MTVQQYCLRWNNHQPNFISVFSSLLSNQSLVDVTLAAEGKHLQAHKVVLSACSSYFQSLFTINPCKHPIVILKDVKFLDLKVMVDFMYHGEVNVSQEQLPCILKTAEMLKIKGLTEIPVDQSAARSSEKCELATHEENWSFSENVRITSPPSPTGRRKRLKKNICSTGTESESASTSSEILLGTVENINVIGTILKSESERYTTAAENTHHTHHHQQNTTPQKCNGLTIPVVQQPGPSHEITEPDPTHHVSLQVTPHDLNTSQTVDCSPIEIPRITTTQQTTAASPPPKPLSPTPQDMQHIGTKRGRFLMRQPRIKRESDPPQDLSDCELGPQPSSSHYLTVPPVRIERQCSDPLPSSVSPVFENLLSVSEHILMKQHSHPLLPTKPTETNNPRSSHCPAVRSGPALGCNYCWNTVDTHGRILRRKTKYHCPECQTNLCIVPCFQEYHKCQEGNSNAQQQSSSLMLTSAVKMFPKTN